VLVGTPTWQDITGQHLLSAHKHHLCTTEISFQVS